LLPTKIAVQAVKLTLLLFEQSLELALWRIE
jgi:hypothetical protein